MHYALFNRGLLVFSSGVVAATVFNKRDTDSSLETLVIPLALNNSSYSVAVDMSPGPDQQSFNFVLTTGTGYSVVAGVGCDDCAGVSSYNVNQSTTAKQLPEVQSVSLLGTNASGNLVEENCQLTQSNGRIQIKHVGRNGDFSATVFSGWLSRNPGKTNFTYGMMLNPPWDSGTNGGVLHWQSPDASNYEGDVVWKSISAFNSTSLQSDWFITMDSLSITNGGNVTISQSGELVTAIDPFESAVIFPQTIARAIYGGIADASLLPSLTTTTNRWAIPCDTKMSLIMTFGSLSVPMDEKTLVLQSRNVCIGTIEEWSDPQAGEYLLGSSFISLLYLIFSVSGSSQGEVGFAHRKSPAHLSAGQVTGIVLGSVLFTILLGLGFFLYHRRQRKHQKTALPSPFISPPVTPKHRALLEENPEVASLSLIPPFNRDESRITSPHGDSQEIMVVLPSSVHTPLRPDHTPTVTSFEETPPPYHQSVTYSGTRVRAQKSQTTLQTDIILA
ncbi:aspartic peptidase domain-containing protein [Lentinula aciculospora]|uniref:Aspartic peptidase domain-containing protein n=1 Tax=Lentinula aciculospora TaxID=153920 RepID=A0A9W9APT6_9AGAR|nr:aspartic peptidase domain-containing protein [Lentinula aciculospora]